MSYNSFSSQWKIDWTLIFEKFGELINFDAKLVKLPVSGD